MRDKRRPHGRRLRVGFVSTFFYAHSVGRTTIGLIADLPRSEFEVLVFSIAPHGDPWAEGIQQRADAYCVLPLELEAVRKAILAAELDVLVFADLGMHPLTYFLAFSRLAPVQLTTWGHPVTSGIDTVDYYVSSTSLETPGAEDRYSERLLRLPGYFLPRYQKTQVAAQPDARERLGLPTQRRVYCCPQSLFKLHPDFDAALREILERDGEGQLLLLESSSAWATLLRHRFATTLGKTADRVRFLPPLAQADFHHLLACVDVVLDPFHFGGCNSSCEALALGVPVVTLPGSSLPGRFTVALYEEMGIQSCTAGSPAAYVDLAVLLGRDRERREAVASAIRERNECLFQRPDAARAFGEALRRIVD